MPFALLGKGCKGHNSRAVVGMERSVFMLKGSAMQRSGNRVDRA